MPIRVLIITDQADFGRVLEHHITVFWDDAEIRFHSPALQGVFDPAFSAAGYDVVVLDGECATTDGTGWLRDLSSRPGFPPIVYFSDKIDAATAIEQGALAVQPRERIDHRVFAGAMREALDRRKQTNAQLSKQELERHYRFGEVTIRGQRCIKEIGVGGTSRVYLAESEKAGEVVVLKVLSHNPDTADSSEGYDRFLQEYELLSRIRHPNVVRIYDFGVADDHAYIAMEYFEPGDLRKRLGEVLTVGDALSYVEQIARALAAVHKVGVLHRDLKPGNIMLRADGSLALIDFGVAKHLSRGTSMTAAGTIFGTPYYMSPEQGHGERVDERGDLYSLGIIFYEMLMQKRPYSSSTVMNVIYMHRNAPLPELAHEYSWLEPTVHRLMAKDPKHRFQSAAEVVSTLGLLKVMASTMSLNSSRVGL
jgi:tRNA A-37 threonylcarbamoyl transferase component Bud32